MIALTGRVMCLRSIVFIEAEHDQEVIHRHSIVAIHGRSRVEGKTVVTIRGVPCEKPG